MNTTISPLRRIGATFALAGLAALGSVALAPAASAAPANVQDGPASVVEGTGGNGPDAFIVFEHGVKPVFFCDLDNPNKRHNNCEWVVVDGPRF